MPLYRLTGVLVAVLLLVPGWAAVGAGLALGLISGAIFTHLTSLGIVVRDPATGEGDGGLLFALALVVAVGSAVVLAVRWPELPVVGRWLASPRPVTTAV